MNKNPLKLSYRLSRSIGVGGGGQVVFHLKKIRANLKLFEQI